jgi:hypothetical protein
VDWTVSLALPEVITVNLEFLPWLVVGYFFWGAAVVMISLKAENDSKADLTNEGFDWIWIPILGSMIWPWMLYHISKGHYNTRAEYEEEVEASSE